jgi:hypothetical protein
MLFFKVSKAYDAHVQIKSDARFQSQTVVCSGANTAGRLRSTCVRRRPDSSGNADLEIDWTTWLVFRSKGRAHAALSSVDCIDCWK